MKNFLIILTTLMCCWLPAEAQNNSTENTTSELTVASWNDPGNWAAWQQQQKITFKAEADKWPLPLHQRYSVLVNSLQGQPVRNCRVQLLDNSGEALWLSQTNALGQAELWCEKDKKAEAIRVYFQDQAYTVDSPQPFENGVSHFSISATCQPPAGIDVLALVDATHSMRDEFDAILQALAKSQEKARETAPDFKMHTMLFRDYGERFLTLPIELEGEGEKRDFRWQAAGGGAEAEPIDTALMTAIQSHHWRPEADARLLLLFTDAIPKTGKGASERLAKAMKLASAAGITIVPVTCSGLTAEGEYLLRSLALATNAPYAFLTDGGSTGDLHRRPAITGDTEEEALAAWVIGLIQSLSNESDCPEATPPIPAPSLFSGIQCYPNPASEQANLQLPEAISRLSVRNSLGQVVHRREGLNAGQHLLDVHNWPAGAYWLEFEREGAVQAERLVVER